MYKKGQTVRSPYCAIKFAPGKSGTYRVAVVVGKKVNKSAPVRNRIRRRVYESVFNNAKLLAGQDIVITIFDDRFLNMPFKELDSSIKRQLKQVARSS